MQRAGTTIVLMLLALGVAAALPPVESNAERSAARDTSLRLLGATRGYVSTGLWLRAGESFRRGDYFETLATYQLIRELQPRNPAVYSYLAWNQAYNISPQFPSRDRQFEWLQRGFTTLHEGQKELPKDATLFQDEWNFLLTKTAGYPVRLVKLLAPRHDDQAFALIVGQLITLRDELTTDQLNELETFLDETGMDLLLFDQVEALLGLPPDQQDSVLDLNQPLSGDLADVFPEITRQRINNLLALDDDLRTIVALGHWARLHLLALTLEPAMKILPRSLTTDTAILNSYRLASLNCPPQLADNFQNTYRTAVERAYKLGIENARKRGGNELATEFKLHMRENFEELPGWLPE
jgi:hypothetical protein